jgi:hypothetical protein
MKRKAVSMGARIEVTNQHKEGYHRARKSEKTGI